MESLILTYRSATPIYIQNSGIVLRQDQEGALLFNPDTYQIRASNSTGLAVWRACDGHRNLVDIVAVLRETFEDAPQGMLIEQVRAFVDDMTANGFVGHA